MGHPDEGVGTVLCMTSLCYGAAHCVGQRFSPPLPRLITISCPGDRIRNKEQMQNLGELTFNSI